VSNELIVYIKGLLHQGRTKDEIRQTLLTRGWSAVDVDAAFNQLYAADVTVPVGVKSSQNSWFSSKWTISIKIVFLCLGFWVFGILTSVLANMLLTDQKNAAVYSAMIRQYPEVDYVNLALINTYGAWNTYVNVNMIKNFAGDGQPPVKRIISAGVISKNRISAEERYKLGNLICDLLAARNTIYDVVEVNTTHRTGFVITTDKYDTEGRNCYDWKNNPAKELP
jgi:hypothetical protein